MFETADDFVEVMAKEEAAKVAQRVRAEGVGEQSLPDVSVQTKSMCLQSFTVTELFYKCSANFPQVEIHGGCNKKETAALRLWFGQAFNLDEAYEFLESLSLLGSRGDKAKDSSVNAHASTLNTLLARGKTKRATRTSTSYEASRTQRVSLSFLGNGHPGKLIQMERNLEGQHTAATKERFLLCVDVSVLVPCSRRSKLLSSAGPAFSTTQDISRARSQGSRILKKAMKASLQFCPMVFALASGTCTTLLPLLQALQLQPSSLK